MKNCRLQPGYRKSTLSGEGNVHRSYSLPKCISYFNKSSWTASESNLISVQHSDSRPPQPKFRTSRKLFTTDGKVSNIKGKGVSKDSNKGLKPKLITTAKILQQICWSLSLRSASLYSPPDSAECVNMAGLRCWWALDRLLGIRVSSQAV